MEGDRVERRRSSAGYLRRVASVGVVASVWLAASASAAVAAPPSIGAQWVTGVTPTNATLNAEIDPNGLPTAYKLQIDATGNFSFFQTDGCVLHPPGVLCTQAIVPGDPLPPGLVEPPESSLPAATESQHVSVDLSTLGATLQPGTTYHYRAVAANGLPIVEGPAQTFTTPEGPSIQAEPAATPPSAAAGGGQAASVGPTPPAPAAPAVGRRKQVVKRPGRCNRKAKHRSARRLRHGKRCVHRPAGRR
jgi:hypothetical protein